MNRHRVGHHGLFYKKDSRPPYSSLSMDLAMKVGFLAFDATCTSSTSVEYPIDVVLYRHDTFDIVDQRFEKEDLPEISSW